MKLGQALSLSEMQAVSEFRKSLTIWDEDPNISVIAIYLEGIKNGKQFLEIGKKVTKKKR